ncbi:MAG TPA: class I SAM-dependent methyltransferase [Polyangiaceae bacterium]
MRRAQLFEFEDLPWFPGMVRECMTDFLSFMGRRGHIAYRAFAPRFRSALDATADDTIVDLCSGGGGPALAIRELVSEEQGSLSVVLTDLYPNVPRLARMQAEGGGSVHFRVEPVDATAVPESLDGFRLICNGFHHLPPDSARACLADAVGQRRGIAVVELASRSAPSILGIVVGTLALLAVTPFIRPVTLPRLLLTYLVPVVPLCTAWDGVVSCLRAYEPEELHELVNSLPANDYVWDIGRLPVPRVPTKLTYLIGYPKPAEA